MKLLCNRCQQANASSGIPVTSVRGIDGITDMTGVQLQVRRRADPKIDRANRRARFEMDHSKVVCRNLVHGMSGEFDELKLQITIHKVIKAEFFR